MEIGNFEIENITCEFILIIICKQTGKKINPLARVSQYMNLSKRKVLINAFFD